MNNISIITAVYNSEEEIVKLISSLQNQSCKDFEWIVADGGSTDDTLDILRQVDGINMKVDSRPDCGIFDAINRGIRLSSGAYYLVIGSDDILYRDAIKNFQRMVVDGKFDVIIANVKVEDKIRSGVHPQKKWLGAAHMVTEHSVGMLIKKSLHDIAGMYSGRYVQCADAYFIKKIFQMQELKYCVLDEVVGEFSVQGTSNSNVLRGLCEGFMVQVETERNTPFQFSLFILRLLKNYKRIVKESSSF